MNTKILMTASALVLALTGVAASFAPAELLAAWGASASPQTVILVQILGALSFGFAFLNWSAKGVMIGGIYARPIALGNFLHFTMGALALAKQAGSPSLGASLIVALVIYAIFAILFGLLVFGRARG
jgi:hypothetical protein